MTSLNDHQQLLTKSTKYMASANILNTTTWIRESHGEIVVDCASKGFVGVVVGRVDPQKLNCGPEGNHIRAEISPLEKAKYQFNLCRPYDGPFVDDFDKSIVNLEKLQSKVAVTSDRRNMLLSEMNSKLIRFTSNVFQKRDVPVPVHTLFLADLENSEVGGGKDSVPPMDMETENWPIPAKHRAEFDIIKYNFWASPLHLYRDNKSVEPTDANEALSGAIVEVVFTLRHYYLRGKNFDSFQADIQQIKILKRGRSIHGLGIKRRNARDGPADLIGLSKEKGREGEMQNEGERPEKRPRVAEMK